jgi:hypothetical protein
MNLERLHRVIVSYEYEATLVGLERGVELTGTLRSHRFGLRSFQIASIVRKTIRDNTKGRCQVND